MMRESTSDADIGVKVGGYVVKSVRFADDKAVMAILRRGFITNGQHKQGRKELSNEIKCEKDWITD